MKAFTASFVIGLALALLACGPAARDQGTDAGNGVGSGSGSGSSSARCTKMDLVFVVDDSGSMSEEQSNLAQNFQMFADVLLNYVNADGAHVDFRVAVTTTGRDIDYTVSLGPINMPMSEAGDNGAFRDSCGVAKRWLDPTDPNLGSTLGCRANVGTNGPGFEMPLLMTKWALADRVADGTNAGFLRDDALLGVVVLTDEDDDSTTQNNFTIGANDPPVDYHPADAVQFLDTLKGDRSRWAAGVIAGPTACTSSFGAAREALRLKQFVQLANTNGTQQAVFASICDGDLSVALREVLAKFQSACGGIIL